MFPRLTRTIFDLASGLLTRRVVSGMDNLPPSGPYIIVINHLSFFDLPFVYGLLGGEKLTGWAAEKYERHPFFGPILKLLGAIFIDRGKVDRDAIARAVDWLQNGNILGIAPEGTRSPKHTLARGKTGTAYLAHEARVPILPIGIHGTERFWSSWLRLRRPTFAMTVGQLFHLPEHDPSERQARLRTDTDEIMCRIAALLPPEYRGVYSDHPRLRELLASSKV